jgi:hypothetical protein
MGQEGLAERLRSAIDHWEGGGIRPFQKALASMTPRPRGSSLAMIHRYLDRDPEKVVEPPRAFLEAAAELLGVRAEWLWSGTGERTSAAETVRKASELEAAAADVQPHAVLDALGKAFPDFSELPSWCRAVVLETVRRAARRTFEAYYLTPRKRSEDVQEVIELIQQEQIVQLAAVLKIDPDLAAELWRGVYADTEEPVALEVSAIIAAADVGEYLAAAVESARRIAPSADDPAAVADFVSDAARALLRLIPSESNRASTQQEQNDAEEA